MTTRRNSHSRLLVIFSVISALTNLAWAQTSDGVLLIDQPVETDVYAAHREVEVRAAVDGDLVAAGRRVAVNGDVAGDIIVAGQDIEIQSGVSDDLRAAGQHIHITAPVSGHVVAAGWKVTLDQDVGDWAWLAGNTVEVLGNVGSDLKVRATRIRIDAEVDGNVELIGDELDLGPNAVVRGDLRWRSRNEAEINPYAQIDGEFIEEPLPGLVEELSTGGKYSLPLNTIVAVMVLFLLFSESLRVCADRIATRPGRSLLLGLAAFLVMPILAVLLFSSGVGVWLGFAVLFIYLLVLLLGVLTGLFAASNLVLRRLIQQPAMWQSLAAIFVTVVAVGLLAKIPWLGIILVVAILLIGVGALCWTSWAALRRLGDRELQTS
jgi:cytoskeletal protein CcmA (bactofilin family)